MVVCGGGLGVAVVNMSHFAKIKSSYEDTDT